ncbi:MAG TPA: hypothetical protein VHZ77_10490 [Gaiellaceae bacterium]|jgi:hypothetical protein|nr:hypothetical protein [Gaiellaceae bacterium]
MMMNARARRITVGVRLGLFGLIVCIGSAAAVWFGFSTSSHRLGFSRRSLVPPITMANPLAFGQKTRLPDADTKLGATIALPNSPQMSTSDVGSVWVRQDGGGQSTSVAVTLPAAGLILQFVRPAPYPQPPAQMYQTEASQEPDSMSVIDLNGVPALATKQDSDQTGQNFGAIEFVVNGTRIAVLGHYDLATLRAFATPVLAAASG